MTPAQLVIPFGQVWHPEAPPFELVLCPGRSRRDVVVFDADNRPTWWVKAYRGYAHVRYPRWSAGLSDFLEAHWDVFPDEAGWEPDSWFLVDCPVCAARPFLGCFNQRSQDPMKSIHTRRHRVGDEER